MAMRTNIFVGLLSLALLGLSAAWGLELYQTQTYSFSASSASLIDDEYFDLNAFAHSWLPFRQVELILSGYYAGTASVTNDDGTASPVTLSLSGSEDLTVLPPDTPALSLTAGQMTYSTVVNAPANATTDFPLTTPTVTATKIYTGAEVEAFRAPPATIEFLLELAAHVFNATFEQGKQISATYNGLVYSTVTLKYYVPEPGTGVVLGLAALAMLRRRRC